MLAAGEARLRALEKEGVPRQVIEHVLWRQKMRSGLESSLAEDGTDARREEALQYKRAAEELLRAQREAAVKLRDQQVIDDDVLRHIEDELDLEELRLASASRHARREQHNHENGGET
jgi:hypothetical protein